MKFTKKQIIAICVVIILIPLIILLTIFVYDAATIKVFEEYETRVKFDTYVGINVDAGLLNFGTLPLRSNLAKKKIVVTNNLSYPLYLEIEAFGEMKDWLYFEIDPVIKPHTQPTIVVFLTPFNMTLRNYTGKVRIILRKKIILK